MATRGGPLFFAISPHRPIRRTLRGVSPPRLVAAVALLAACPAYPVLDTTSTETSSATTSPMTSGLTALTVPTTGEPASSTTGVPTTGDPTTGDATTDTTTTGTSTSTSSTSTSGDSSSSGDTTGTTGDQGTCPDPNSHEVDGQCFCDFGYGWCAPDDINDLSCCLDDGTTTDDTTGGKSTGTTG